MDDHKALLRTIRRLPTASFYEAAGKEGDMAPSIQGVLPSMRFAGFAFTVRTQPGDNLGVFHAIDRAQPDDVLVIDAGDTDRVTIWGGTSTVAAKARGIVACVTNAAVRDIDEIRNLDFPVFSRGISVRGAVRNHPGWLGGAVSVGDTIVRPGDLVVGDAAGVVVVHSLRVEEVVARAVEMEQTLQQREGRLRNGENVLTVLGISR
jgi:4-hydroxy-4-methyl-2-oxoglutarate aldolase